MDRLRVPPNRRPRLCAGLGQWEALANLDGILAQAAAVVVSRSDLSLELGANMVPFVEKLLLAKARQARVMVIAGTQVVDSMNKSSAPTHAEVSELCNAVWDGVDAFTLIAETATGKYPLEAVLATAAAMREAESTAHRLQP